MTIGVDEGRAVEAIDAGPGDLEAGIGFLEGDGLRIAVAGEACGEVIGGVEEPGVACFGREQDKLVGGDNACVASGCASLDGANLIGESKPAAIAHSFARSGLDRRLRGEATDVFTKLFGELPVFVYHGFDRIVIYGYLTALSRPELVLRFFRDIVGVAEVGKEALSHRTSDYLVAEKHPHRKDRCRRCLILARRRPLTITIRRSSRLWN